MNRIFVDTGAWFARFVPDDAIIPPPANGSSRTQIRLVTTDYIIDELLTVLKIRNEFQRALELGGPLLNGDVCDLEWVTQTDVQMPGRCSALSRQGMEFHGLR